MDIPRTGIMIGKFMPFHKGHEYLIDFARNFVISKLYVVVCNNKYNPSPMKNGLTRWGWLKDHYADDPKVEIILYSHANPEYPKDENDTEFWNIWREGLKDLDKIKWPVQYLFAGEPYGKRLALELKAKFIPLEREAINISGTEIRENPWTHNWNKMTHEAQQWYLRKVCIVGPESVGKSTMAKELARRFNSKYVPEYGRSYLEGMEQDDWSVADIEKIVLGHGASEAALQLQAKRALIVDTDIFISKLYCEFVGDVPEWINTAITGQMGGAGQTGRYDLWLVLTPEMPWVSDPLRGEKPQTDRWKFFGRIIEHFNETKTPYVIISGNNYADRIYSAYTEIWKIMREFSSKNNFIKLED